MHIAHENSKSWLKSPAPIWLAGFTQLGIKELRAPESENKRSLGKKKFGGKKNTEKGPWNVQAKNIAILNLQHLPTHKQNVLKQNV